MGAQQHGCSWVKMNSTNWSAPNVWVFMAQLVEHWSANAEAMGSNPVEDPKFFQVNLSLLKLQLQHDCDDHMYI